MNNHSIKYDEEVYDDFITRLKSRSFEYLGAGSFRRVYGRRNVVVKVPTMEDGLFDNLIEAHAWRVLRNKPSQSGVICAPNRLLPNGCLMMVKLDTSLYDDKYRDIPLPNWVGEIEKAQVGFYKGRVLAYDYAIDLVERHNWERALQIESDFFKNDWVNRDQKIHLRDPDADYSVRTDGTLPGACNCTDCKLQRVQDRLQAQNEEEQAADPIE